MKTINLLNRHSREGGNLGRVQLNQHFKLSTKLCMVVGWIPAFAGMTMVGI